MAANEGRDGGGKADEEEADTWGRGGAPLLERGKADKDNYGCSED